MNDQPLLNLEDLMLEIVKAKKKLHKHIFLRLEYEINA